MFGPLYLIGDPAIFLDVSVELNLLAGVQRLADVAAVSTKVSRILDKDVLSNFFLDILLLDPDLRDEMDDGLLDGVEARL